MTMTKGTPPSSQIIWLENMVKSQDDEIERLKAELDEYVQEVMRQHKVIAGMQDHAFDLTRQIKEMRAEIVRLRVEAGYD